MSERRIKEFMGSIKQEELLERIAVALEGIDRSLENVDQSLELMSDILSDSQVKNPYGSAIAVAGTINVID